MTIRRLALVAVFHALAVPSVPASAAASCKIEGLAEIPVTMRRSQPMIPAKINGADVQFLLDSGAFYSIISPASATALNLPKTLAPAGFVVKGLGGDSQTMLATVRDFGLAGAVVNNMEFLVGGGSWGDAIGLLGQNVLSFADVEYDFGGGAIRLVRAQKCKDADRVYWAKPGDAVSSVTIAAVSKFEPHVIGTAYLNGKKIRVLFDTGASTSVLTLRAAERAGVKITSEGVVEAGYARGLGSRVLQYWIAPFESFKIGEEEIRNTRLRIADIPLSNADMLLGSDFFLSHRIYIAHSVHKVLFTYRGGPVFDLGTSGNPEVVESAGDGVDETREPVDAQGYSRRASVQGARGDHAGAIADLNRAIELAPSEPQYFYQRANFHGASRQPMLALADLNQAISLKADHAAARLARAGLLSSRLEATGGGAIEDIIADIDVARTAATRESDVHFEAGRLYAGVGAQEQALAAFDQWLALHRDDARAADARAGSCRARALLERELSKALDDCNAAVRDRLGMPLPLESRGLVHLRLRNFDKAIADYDKVLAEQPRNAWALYGRGLAKLGKGSRADGELDIAKAKAANPRAVANAVSRGLVP